MKKCDYCAMSKERLFVNCDNPITKIHKPYSEIKDQVITKRIEVNERFIKRCLGGSYGKNKSGGSVING